MIREGKQGDKDNEQGLSAQAVPSATYRLQFNRQFTFRQAAELAEYLRQLGISHCYASPLFKACHESTHGYDICGFDQINPNLGAREGFERFVSQLRAQKLGLLLDMVPNHMAADMSNPWWRDVLEHGPGSRFAAHLDIDWQRDGMQGKVLSPVLEDDCATVLNSGKLRLVKEDGRCFIAYHEKRFPVSPESLRLIESEAAAGQDALNVFNGTPGSPQSFEKLRQLLDAQHYRLAHWQDAARQINYRRFFDVSDLVSLRMELPEVFGACHALVFSLIEKEQVNGLRIDHPDGLPDPTGYFSRLKQSSPRSIYVVAEKILAGDEPLPNDWPVEGTTGYDFLNRVNGLFVDARNEQAFGRIYREFTGAETDFKEVVCASKKQVLENSFGSELNNLTRRLEQIAAESGRKSPPADLQNALAEVIAAFPVYRTYVRDDTVQVSSAQRNYIEQAIEAARGRNPTLDSALEFLRAVLLLRLPESARISANELAREFLLKFQQLTGPVMAKGVEDTAFYRFNRFVSLNEVGGDPNRFGVSVEEFHDHNRYMREHWPHSMLATATHDTKRGEDVRARLNVLSEMPEEWNAAVMRWRRMNADKKTLLGNAPAPAANDEYLLYQTLVGAWPASATEGTRDLRDRINAYMLKAIREAKLRTSWTEPDSDYEKATMQFVNALLSDGPKAFLEDFKPFQNKVAFFGMFNSLAQTLLKITSPGVPDFYQGTELWDLSLVDPDNRQPVDFDLRRSLLAKTAAAAAFELLKDWQTGQIKMLVIQRALEFRRANPELFQDGEYIPVMAAGPKAQHTVALLRRHGEKAALIIVPRLVFSLTAGHERPPLGADTWQDTRVLSPYFKPETLWRNVFTNEEVVITGSVAELALHLSSALKSFPLGLFESTG